MIRAEGEALVSLTLREAASGMSPVALQLRHLQSLSTVSGSASVVVGPLPAELLDRVASLSTACTT